MLKKLTPKDLISVGIFTAIYIIVFFACGMLGYVPIMFVLLPLYFPVVTGIPVMLFFTKVDKFGMITLMAVISGLLMFATGHTWIPLITGLVFGLLGDLTARAGNYSRFRNLAVGYGVFTIWPIGAMLPMWFMRDSYFDYIRASMGDDYVNTIMAMTPNWLPLVFFGAAFLAGIAGAFLGRSVLKKHFQKAGIV